MHTLCIYIELKPDLLLFKVPSCISSTRLHASNPNLSSAALVSDKVDPESLESPFDVAKLQEDFCRVAASREPLNCPSVHFEKMKTEGRFEPGVSNSNTLQLSLLQSFPCTPNTELRPCTI